MSIASARDWPERLPTPTQPRGHTELEHIARYRWAASQVSGRVLDAACGTGYGTAMLSERAEAYGVDRDPGAIDEARRLAPAATFVRADLPRLDFADGSFDAIVSFETIEHVEDDAGLLAQFHRVLGPGGTLLISTPNGTRTEEEPNPWHMREYRLDELLDLMRRAGFSDDGIFAQRVPSARAGVATRQIKRFVARFPVLCRPGRWWDTIAHGSPEVIAWDGQADPFFWIIRARRD